VTSTTQQIALSPRLWLCNSPACPLVLVSAGKPGTVLVQYGSEVWRSCVLTNDHRGLESPEGATQRYIMYLLPSHGTSGMNSAAQPGLSGQTVLMGTNSVLPPY